MDIKFESFQKIPRLSREIIVTEKIDGTNACIVIGDNGEFACQSRSRFITPDDDNYGFARWAYANIEELSRLGPGYHYGEWWGQGIQRGYGLTEKRFSLFNTRRWGEHNPNTPQCCHVVPMLRASDSSEVVRFLQQNGSVAAPGWERPEGAVMYEPDTDTCFKIIMDK